MIEFFYPYKNLIDEDWDDILKIVIPKIIDSRDELGYKLIIPELNGKVQDTHANICQQNRTLNVK
jgi:hypothetical protein